MRPGDVTYAETLHTALKHYQRDVRVLPGIEDRSALRCFLEQLVESVRRDRYIEKLRSMDHARGRSDPHSEQFDPIRAAIVHSRTGNHDEACWLVFLSVHFGRHLIDRWRLARDVYGRLRGSPLWSWDLTSNSVADFQSWLADALPTLQNGDPPRRFGNHRKYEKLARTGEVVESYVNWVTGSHDRLIKRAIAAKGNGPPREVFDYLYRSMDDVMQFGRTAKFDYLCMLGKLKLAPIEPGFTYMAGATGPYEGAKLLFGLILRRGEYESLLVALEEYLGVGLQALEDALCNWQKSPRKFRPFRG